MYTITRNNKIRTSWISNTWNCFPSPLFSRNLSLSLSWSPHFSWGSSERLRPRCREHDAAGKETQKIQVETKQHKESKTAQSRALTAHSKEGAGSGSPDPSACGSIKARTSKMFESQISKGPFHSICPQQWQSVEPYKEGLFYLFRKAVKTGLEELVSSPKPCPHRAVSHTEPGELQTHSPTISHSSIKSQETSQGTVPGASVSISEGLLEEMSVCSACIPWVVGSWKEMEPGNTVQNVIHGLWMRATATKWSPECETAKPGYKHRRSRSWMKCFVHP